MCVLDCFLKMAVPVPPIPHSQCEFVKWEVCVFIPLTKEDSMIFPSMLYSGNHPGPIPVVALNWTGPWKQAVT